MSDPSTPETVPDPDEGLRRDVGDPNRDRADLMNVPPVQVDPEATADADDDRADAEQGGASQERSET